MTESEVISTAVALVTATRNRSSEGPQMAWDITADREHAMDVIATLAGMVIATMSEADVQNFAQIAAAAPVDDADRLNCDDVVCARGGHYACHDLPPPKDEVNVGGGPAPPQTFHRDAPDPRCPECGPDAVRVAEMGGAFEGGPDSVE